MSLQPISGGSPRRSIKKFLALFLCWIMIFTSLPLGDIIPASRSYADVDAGLSADGKSQMMISNVNFVRVHNGFDTASAYIEVQGTGLKGAVLKFDTLPVPPNPGGLSTTIGTKINDEDSFIKYTFTSSEALLLTGKVRIGTKTIDLQLASFPTVSSVGSKNIHFQKNISSTTPEHLQLNGTNLDKIKTSSGDTAGVKATFGRAGVTEFFYGLAHTAPILADSAQRLTVEKPLPPENAGYQSIKLQKDGAFVDGATSCATSVGYYYGNAFRFLDDVALTNLQMFPNTGGQGDQVFFDADYINTSKTYAVYFLTTLDGSDDFTSVNKATNVSIIPKSTPTGKDRLIVKVPEDPAFAARNYYVVITNILNGEVVASQTVTKADGTTPDTFTVLQSNYKPTIETVFPASGPDTGGPVQISGRNILTASLPGLDGLNAGINDVYTLPSADSNKTLHIAYDSGYKFNGVAATVTRDVTVQIGKMATFQTKTGTTPPAPNVLKGTPDNIVVKTDTIDDADVAPAKDVVVDVATTIVAGGVTYVFRQVVTKTKGFTFIPSTLPPTITKVSPPQIAIEPFTVTSPADNLFKLRNQTYVSIEGTNFMVQQYVDTDGVVRTRYPSVLFKKNSDNTLMDDYQLAFLPNELDATTKKGVIKYERPNGAKVILTDSGGTALSADVVVLNNNGEVVTGIPGNDVGTRILVRVPVDARIADIGSKHVQVTNPRRGSTSYGSATLKTNAVDFINIDDAPAISSVDPTILTVDGGQDIKVSGKNFQVGMKVFLDGKEITGFTRTAAPGASGDTVITFKSNKSRECVTQILLLNPSGGTAVRTVTYVKALQNAPILSSFTPTKGTPGTLVVINGDNFQQPDPTVTSATGLDANRLIGTRVFFDGKDVNNYNLDGTGEIVFNPYTKPTVEDLVRINVGRAEYSNYKDNTVVTRRSDGKVMKLGYDNTGNPMLIEGAGNDFTIKAVGGVLKAFDNTGTDVGAVAQTAAPGATLTIGASPTPATTFDVVMDNNVLFVGREEDGTKIAKTANYAGSISLYDPATKSYSTLTTDLNGHVILSNGKDSIYTVTYNNATAQFNAAKNGGTAQVLTVASGSLSIGAVTYNFLTPYTVSNGQIIGNRTHVITKNQISFVIPKDRNYSKGYKDVTVANPDTKSDSKTGNNGFYLVPQASSNPIISSIAPDKGSVDGGYNITINGSGFADTAKVYIDSVFVPVADTHVALDGKSITLKVPKCTKDLVKDFNTDHFAVPVVVVNDDGGSAYRENGFTYLIPISSPVITKVIPLTGSANGGQIVEILGSEFRFFEPYEDTMNQGGYVLGDKWTNLFGNAIWDDLLESGKPAYGDPGSPVAKVTDGTITGYGYYYTSPILPKIYFGEKEAKIVEFSNGYLKVITPPHAKGAVDLFVVNNDYGVSNKMTFTYTASSPKITSMIPNKGRRTGQEMKDVYGSEFYATTIKGYYNDVDSAIVTIPDVKALARFGSIDNRSVPRDDANSGMINNQRATVNLTGGLKVEYKPDGSGKPELVMSVDEGGKTYTRAFTNYDGSVAYLPMEMLKNGSSYYVPFNYTEADGTTYKNNVYEYIRVSVEDRALKVERGYAPKSVYDNKGHVQVMTPSYYTIDTVPMTLTNDDGGTVSTPFTYTNPASIPKIYQVQPFVLSTDGTYMMVEGALNGNIEIEILGKDLRKGAKVSIGGKDCTVVETTTKVVNGVTYDLIIAKIPTGTTADIDQKYPVVVENTDGGLANSSTLNNLIGPNYNALTLPIYFQYRKPLSGPKITSISPAATSVNGGNTITVTGTDFRTGAYVIIGSRGGVPVKDVVISNNGTVLTFVTPTTLTLGDKDIQVINSDFGTDTKNNGLKVVSYPKTLYMYDSKHNSVSRLSTEGGQTITIVGSGFSDGAQVIFGGTSTATVDPIGSGVGLWRNDQHYRLTGGVLGTNVNVLDSTAITVTTPAIKTEGPIIITVINRDSGMSDGNLIAKYSLPIPSDVTTLSVRVVDKKYVQLYDYASENMDYYEIYYYIGQTSEGILKGSNNYQDFKLLDVTTRQPYKILDLPGYESKSSKDYVWFVVKAVNKYGASNYSNLASLTESDLKDLAKVGAPDLDGPAGVPVGKEYQAYVKDGKLSTNLSNSLGNVSMTLTSYVSDKYPIRQINIPSARVLGDYGTTQVDYGDIQIKFTPLSLSTSEFRSLNQDQMAYGQITTSILNNSFITSAKLAVPRNLRMVSPTYQFEFAAVNNKSKAGISKLGSQMQLQFDYGRYALTASEESKMGVFKFNNELSQWEKIRGSQNKNLDRLTIGVVEPGLYMILTTK